MILNTTFYDLYNQKCVLDVLEQVKEKENWEYQSMNSIPGSTETTTRKQIKGAQRRPKAN